MDGPERPGVGIFILHIANHTPTQPRFNFFIQGGGAAEGDLDMATIKKFVSYCRQRCAPRLGPEAGQTLASEVGAGVM